MPCGTLGSFWEVGLDCKCDEEEETMVGLVTRTVELLGSQKEATLGKHRCLPQGESRVSDGLRYNTYYYS